MKTNDLENGEHEKQRLDREYLRAFERLLGEIVQYGYKWSNPSESSDRTPPYKSLEDYVNQPSGALLEVLGKWWGCTIPNLYFYDRTRDEAEGQVQWFHEVVEGGIDMPWLRSWRGHNNDPIFEYEIISKERKTELRRQQQDLRTRGRLAASIVFKMFAEGRYKRRTSEEHDGWILVPLGEILAGAFEWRLRREAAAVHKEQPGTDLVRFFTETHPVIVENIWGHLMKRFGESSAAELCFRETMLGWLENVITDEREFRAWWNEWPEGNYDWFIAYARSTGGALRLRDEIASMDFPKILHALVQIIVTNWDYRYTEGKDRNSERFLQRLRFSPEMEVEHFGTRNLVSFPLWIHWLRNGKETEDAQRTHAAFLLSGFHDAEVAHRYARDIQCVFLLLAQPYVARHSLPALMLAKSGLLAESAAYMFTQELNTISNCAGRLRPIIGSLRAKNLATPLILEGEQLARIRSAISDIERAVTRAVRVRDDLYWLPNNASLVESAARRESININQLLTEVADSCALEDDGIQVVQTGMDPNLPAVHGDQATLRHVFMEVLLNAKHAIKDRASQPDGPVPEKRVAILTKKIEKNVVVTVSDTGIGMDAESASRMFQPFFTTKRTNQQRGLGLGLWNAQLIIQRHNGRINMTRTVPGQGTDIQIVLPVAEEQLTGNYSSTD